MPHLADLDVPVTDALAARRNQRRIIGKQKDTTACRRDYKDAWEDYRLHHIVSEHAARLIRNFMMSQMSESAEVEEECDAEQGKKESWENVDTDFCSIELINQVLHTKEHHQSEKKKRGRSRELSTITCELRSKSMKSCGACAL